MCFDLLFLNIMEGNNMGMVKKKNSMSTML